MDLHLQIDGDEIVVTRPGTDFELVYGRPRGRAGFVCLKRSWISRTDATPAVNEFRRAAQQEQPPRHASWDGTNSRWF